MARYKVNVIWEAEIELDLDAVNPQGDYCLYSWDELYSKMKDVGIYEDVSFMRMKEEKEG